LKHSGVNFVTICLVALEFLTCGLNMRDLRHQKLVALNQL
jgi:hypothetical protein